MQVYLQAARRLHYRRGAAAAAAKSLQSWPRQTQRSPEGPRHLHRIPRLSDGVVKSRTWNNRLVPNRKRSTPRLYIVTLLIELLCRVHHEKRWTGRNTSWNQDCQETRIAQQQQGGGNSFTLFLPLVKGDSSSAAFLSCPQLPHQTRYCRHQILGGRSSSSCWYPLGQR